MSPTIAPDVSEFQKPVDDTYPHDWLIFRLCFNGNIDAHAAHNLAWAKNARAAGRIKGFTGYVVPLPGGNDACMAALDQLGFPDDAPTMVDAEKWRGESYEIFGDHSDQFNHLAERIRTRQGGDSELAWAYGNRGPDLEVWPRKASWLGWVVASYGVKLAPDAEPNMIGQQYTDGQPDYDVVGWPSSTPPFGRCDHNALYRLPGADMPTAHEIADAVLEHTIYDAAGTTLAKAIRDTRADADAANAKADALAAQNKTLQSQLTALAAQLAKLQTAGIDGAAVADLVVSKMGQRLA